MSAILHAGDLTLAYGNRIAVEQVSLQLAAGQVMALIGPNGAGKSTLLRALNGGIQPRTGEILLAGKSLNSYSRRNVGKLVGVVAQEADVRFPVTVLEFVLGGRYSWATGAAWGWETEDDLKITREVLHETELSHLEDRFMDELSGGERQRCLLARALATEAPVLLLDEPTANLDLAHQARMLSLVRNRCDLRDVASIVITHDLNLASQYADEILLLKQGKLVARGDARSVLTPPMLKEVFAIEVLVDAHPVTGVPRVTPLHGPA
jgi:iron complex transport system ATP-binding protein